MATYFVQSDIGFTSELRAGAKLDFGLDWSDWIALTDGDKITSSSWAPLDPGSPLVVSDETSSDSITSLWIEVPGGTEPGWYTLENSIESQQGRKDSRICLLYVKPGVVGGSALFPSRIIAIAKLRRDRLMLLGNSLLPGITLSDDFLWDKLLAAEAHVEHVLRVPLQTTHFFPRDPTPEQLAALPAGMPWQVDPPYDYDPTAFYGDKWGLLVTRQKPVHSILGMRFNYPSPATTIVDVPDDWIRVDKRYGHVQLVPTGTQYQSMLGGLFLSNLSGGRQLPFTIDLEYRAGLANAATQFPDLIDAVQKMAMVKVVEDGFLPQSGSISADGLSQSLSVDASKYHDAVDTILNGPPGSNGGLVARIHGVRMTVI